MKVKLNDGRLEIYFPERPGFTVTGELKKRGFWWNPALKCWWLARPPFNQENPMNEAIRYLVGIGLPQDEADRIWREIEGYIIQQSDHGMEVELGIA